MRCPAVAPAQHLTTGLPSSSTRFRQFDALPQYALSHTRRRYDPGLVDAMIAPG